jgi:hypothetical protein
MRPRYHSKSLGNSRRRMCVPPCKEISCGNRKTSSRFVVRPTGEPVATGIKRRRAAKGHLQTISKPKDTAGLPSKAEIGGVRRPRARARLRAIKPEMSRRRATASAEYRPCLSRAKLIWIKPPVASTGVAWFEGSIPKKHPRP